eukprot:gene28437-31579_t
MEADRVANVAQDRHKEDLAAMPDQQAATHEAQIDGTDHTKVVSNETQEDQGGDESDGFGPNEADAADRSDGDYDGDGVEGRDGAVFTSDFSDSEPAPSNSDSDISDARERKQLKRAALAEAKAQKQQHRQEQHQQQRQRVDTLMTRKLRPKAGYEDALDTNPAPPTHARSKPHMSDSLPRSADGDEDDGGGADSDPGSMGGGGSDGFEGDDAGLPLVSSEGPLVLERALDEEQVKADLAVVKGMWEWASICEFLFAFRDLLQLKTVFSMESLADALVRSPGMLVPCV